MKSINIIALAAFLSASPFVSAAAKPTPVLDTTKLVETYSDLVRTSYDNLLVDSKNLQAKIKDFTKNPSQVTQEAAKEAWIQLKLTYAPTEAFRFYAGPIDNADKSLEPLMNAWPIDEGYIDYTKDNPNSGIINNSKEFAKLDKTNLIALNEKNGERNVATGFHAVEFLLWGQDFDVAGPGKRSFEDYIPAKNASAKRRAQYLEATADLLVEQTQYLVDAWKKGAAYPQALAKEQPDEILRRILTGLTSLSADEMAGERMTVALEKYDQENEQDCFSDITIEDLISNQKGIIAVFEKTDLKNIFNAKNKAVTKRLEKQMQVSLQALDAIPRPFDKVILEGKNTKAQKLVQKAITSLQKQATLMSEVANGYGVHLNVQ